MGPSCVPSAAPTTAATSAPADEAAAGGSPAAPQQQQQQLPQPPSSPLPPSVPDTDATMPATGSGTSVTSSCSCSGGPPASRFWSDASPDILRHVASHLHPAETACTLRMLNRNTAAALATLADRTLPLSQPAPPAAFAHRWGSLGAMRPLTLQQRHRLLTLTAASGVVANMQVASQVCGLALEHTPEALAAAAAGGHAEACAWLLSKGCPMGPRVLAAAAGAGRVDMCAWLVERAGCSLDGNVLAAAAEGGSMKLCEWLLIHKGCPWSTDAPVAAARGGHVAVVDWLVQQHVGQPSCRRLYVGRLLEGAAEGCDVSTLQRLHGQLVEQQGEQLDGGSVDRVVEAAAASRTPDWREKIRWLLYDKGYPRTAVRAFVRVAEAGHEDEDVTERVELLLREGFPTAGAGAAAAVAGRGWGQALRLLLREGAPADWGTARAAAEGGHLELLQLLRGHGVPLHRDAVRAAARGGHAACVAWLVEQLGPAHALSADVARDATCAADTALMAWLRQAGCEWGAETFVAAAAVGCVAQLEWLAEQDCPVGEGGEAYLQAARGGDLATLACLHSLAVPWGPRGEVFLQSLERGCPLAALRWMAAHGCHVDWARVGWAAAVGAATCQADPRVVDWLRTERRRARSLWGWVVGTTWGWVDAVWRRVVAWEAGGGGGWEAWRESPNPGDGTRIE